MTYCSLFIKTQAYVSLSREHTYEGLCADSY